MIAIKDTPHRIGGRPSWPVADLWANRLDLAEPGTRENMERFYRVFTDFIGAYAAGNLVWDDVSLEATEYFQYVVSKLNPADREPTLKQKGRAKALEKLSDAIALYEDIEAHGLKSPLTCYGTRGEGRRLALVRGGRRLVILHLLGIETAVLRIFQTKADWRRWDAHTDQWQAPVGERPETIHKLAMEQFRRHGGCATDKYWVHGYTPIYDQVLGHLQCRRLKLLEIGIFRGASLALWHAAFPWAKIYGIDKNATRHRKMTRGLDRITTWMGRQEDTDFLREQVIPSGPYDIVIDDCGHVPANQWATFESLWPAVARQGYYIIEDCWHSYHDADNETNVPRNLSTWVDRIYTKHRVLSVQFFYNLVIVQKGLK